MPHQHSLYNYFMHACKVSTKGHIKYRKNLWIQTDRQNFGFISIDLHISKSKK